MRFKISLVAILFAMITIYSPSLRSEEGLPENCYACPDDDSCDCDGYFGDCCGYDCYWCCPGRPSWCHHCSRRAFDLGLRGIWMPQDPALFQQLAADPRQPTYSVAWRFNDNAATKDSIPVSYYSVFPIYRWFNVGRWHGMLQADLEGCLWAIFDPDTFSAPLINADYYVGLKLTYAFDYWSFRLRYFHISSHIGDEYLLNHPDFDRKNPSSETLDFFVSNYITQDIRLYGGLGWVVNCDETFPLKRFLAECGLELRMYGLGFHDYVKDVYGHPFYAMHFRYKPDFHKHIDATYVLGYELGNCCGSQQRLRAFIEYHDGYSVEGQFSKQATTYFSVRVTYGY